VFSLTAKNTQFNDELGVYTVTNDQGAVNGSLPGANGYAAAALATTNSQVIFSPGKGVGTSKTLSFAPGTLLGFYLVQNGNSNTARTSNANNIVSNGQPVTFFSFDAANPDHFNHTTSTLLGDGSAQVGWDDQHTVGPANFGEMSFSVGVAGGSGSSLTGVPGQLVPATFTLTSRNATGDELGVFAVDAPDGKIGGQLPGQASWINTALTSASQHVLFTGSQAAGATATVNLPGGELYGLYLVQNGTTADALAQNPTNQSGKTPEVFFSFVGANPDGFQHLRWTDTTHFRWDDVTGGGSLDFGALDATVTLGTPVPAPPAPPPPSNATPTITTPISNVSVARNAANTTLDLAGNFGATDIVDGNTTVSMSTSSGTINLNLFDKTTPRTAANFVDYVDNGAYNNTIFHRLVANFVLQGGGFQFVHTGNTTTLPPISPTLPAVQNEPGVSNVANTIAMAKLGGNPNSATDEFFFNLANNRGTPPDGLDFQNGGFTAFGQLADQASITTVSALAAALPTQNHGAPFDQIPLLNYNGTQFPTDATQQNFEILNSVTVHQVDSLTYQVTNNTNPGLVTTTVTQNRLTLAYTPNQTGTAVITVQATNKAGHTITQQFTVTVT
jgi:cyclophilin family peptidyl-prolyl cis-trans isomerase